MADDDALTGTIDSMKPWTIKSISTQAINQAIASARQEGIPVGQWLEPRIRDWATGGGGHQAAPAGQPAIGASCDAVADLVHSAIALSELNPEVAKDPLVRTARATVRATLLAARPKATRPTRPKPDVKSIASDIGDQRERLTD